LAKNRLASFKRGELPYGTTIEDIFVEMAQSEGAFDPTGANPLGRRQSDIKVMYHSQNRKDSYAVSISKVQVKGAFMKADGVEDLLSKIINSVYSGATQDEFLIMKEMLASYKPNYYDYGVTAITDEASARAFVRTVRKAVADMSFVATSFNHAGVKTFTDPQEQVLIINKDVINHVDVDVLAKAFNLGKTDFEPVIIVVDDFGSMTDTYGILCDRDFLFEYDTYIDMLQQPNAQGAFTNYFYHVHQLHSRCEFMNAIRFTTVLDAGTDITGFSIPQQTGAATINAVAHTVDIEVAALTDVTALVPTIAVSLNASVSPASLVATDFTNPVTYTVTAEDGTTQDWVVTVTVAI